MKKNRWIKQEDQVKSHTEASMNHKEKSIKQYDVRIGCKEVNWSM